MIYACLDRDIYIANGTTELCANNISGDLAEYFNSYFRVVSYLRIHKAPPLSELAIQWHSQRDSPIRSSIFLH